MHDFSANGLHTHQTRSGNAAARTTIRVLDLDNRYRPQPTGQTDPDSGLPLHHFVSPSPNHLEVPGLILYFADRDKKVVNPATGETANFPVDLLHIDVVANRLGQGNYKTIGQKLGERLNDANPPPWQANAKWYMVAKYNPNPHHARQYPRLWKPNVVKRILNAYKELFDTRFAEV